MKNMKMKSGFTMIELIFVIVVLGILAAVAMPKFVNISSEALVSSEKAMIGSLRSSIGMIRGKAQIKRNNFIMEVSGEDGSEKTVFMEVSKTLYPLSLSTAKTQSNVSKKDNTNNSFREYTNDIKPSTFNTDYILASSASAGNAEEKANSNYHCSTDQNEDCYNTGAIALEQNSRLDIRTSQVKDGKQYIEGVASFKYGPDNEMEDSNLDIDYKGAWVYDSTSGIIVYHKAYADGTEIDYNIVNLDKL